LGFTTTPGTAGPGDSLAADATRTYTLTGNSLIGGTAVGFDLTPVLDSYQDSDGSGTVSFTAENAPSATVTGGNFSLDSSLWANSTTLRMTYNYTIPEPSVAMLGGLGALALLRRRRN
jgi:hypothetical protein